MPKNLIYHLVSHTFPIFLLLTPLAFVTSIKASQMPVGAIESVSGQQCSVSGWAKDPDYAGSITVQIYRGAPAEQGGIFIKSLIANIPRSDVGDHGFSYSLPASVVSFDDPIYVYAVGVDANGNPDGQNISLPLYIPLAPSRQLTCSYIGPEADELARTVDLSQSLGMKVDLGAVEPVMRRNEFGIYQAPDGHISVDVVGSTTKTFFQCVIAGQGQLSCLSENPSIDSFNNLDGLLKDATGNTAQSIMEGRVPGDPYESNYAAIMSTWRDPSTGIIHAWYHAEILVNPSLCGNIMFYASIGYATSSDGGRSFTKHGIVITSPTPVNTNACGGQGVSEPKVIEVGDYLYMFFDFAQLPNYPNTSLSDIGGVAIARASKSNPSVWTKYYIGSFSEAGIGGRITPVIRTGGVNNQPWIESVIANAYLGKYVMIHTDYFNEGAFFIRTSDDLFNWTDPQLLIPSAANWKYRYPTILGRDSKSMGQNGWLYFGRYATALDSLLYRRPISFSKTTNDNCSYALSSNSQSFPKAGGTSSISISTNSGCGWMSSSNANWITATPVGTRFTGNNSVNLSIEANTGTGTRTGTVTIAGQILTITQSAQTPFDFDGDGKSDISVFRPSNGVWYFLNSASGFSAVQFGITTDKIVPADYDGDGKTDVAVWRDGIWYLQRSSAGFMAIPFGQAGDIPMPADFNGDGKAELAVFRPSNGTWYVLNLANNQFNAVQFGQTGDIPVAADYDGDGKSDYAVYRPSNGVWYLLQTTKGFGAIQFGNSTDKPAVGDYDGDGRADEAVYRPETGTWYLLQSTKGFTAIQFGISTDIPAPADFDGDGKTDIAVFRPSSGTWYQMNSTQGFGAIQFGSNNDKPIASAFVP